MLERIDTFILHFKKHLSSQVKKIIKSVKGNNGLNTRYALAFIFVIF